MKDPAVIAASNIVSTIIEKSESPKDVQEILDLYDAIYDHIVAHPEPKSSVGKATQTGISTFGY